MRTLSGRRLSSVQERGEGITLTVHLTCITNKVIIIDTLTGSSSSNTKENLLFWIDEVSNGSRLRMEYRCLSSGLMTAGSALLAAACLMSLIDKVGI